MPRVTLREILDHLGSDCTRFVGPEDQEVTHAAPIKAAGPDALTFCSRSGQEGRSLTLASTAGVTLCSADMLPASPRTMSGTLVVVESPRLSFLRLVNKFFSPTTPAGIHATAIVDPHAQVDPSAYIGPGAYVGPNCRVGEGSVVHGRVYVYPHTSLGKNVIVHAGAILGADGFGFERNESGRLEKFPHVGGVVIEDDVEIGANTCIDRGTLGNTIIRRGAKIDNLVHIAHNVVVGCDAVVIAHAMVGGSTVIGDRGWVAPCACLRDGLTIGSDSTIGLAALVVKDVQEGCVVMGAPAREAEEYKRVLKGLADMVAARRTTD
jgi:UDP-3-O-[3-hydroxymyristoyl] glucosamine N-acyltransferase